MKEGNFAVVVRFEDASNPAPDVQPPLVYWHMKPKAAARRLRGLIHASAPWAKAARLGQRFYIVDHTSTREIRQFSLNRFKAEYGLDSL
jgi:hypothetical protein